MNLKQRKKQLELELKELDKQIDKQTWHEKDNFNQLVLESLTLKGKQRYQYMVDNKIDINFQVFKNKASIIDSFVSTLEKLGYRFDNHIKNDLNMTVNKFNQNELL